MLQINEQKMSKSLGNFFTIRDVLKHYDPEVVRFFLVRAQYRTQISYSDANLEDAKQGLSRLYTALRHPKAESPEVDWKEPHAQRFRAAMDDDFNTPEAVAELHGLANLALQGDAKAAEQLRGLGGVLGLLQRDPEKFFQAGPVAAGIPENEINKKIDARIAARKRKDFAEADRIRRELEALGVILEDGPKGTTWRRK